MQVYLPIAEVSVNAFLLLGLGGMVGILSGMFGVGGGFLMTPLLFFIGIPPAVAVATEANQIVASSFSGALAHFRRKTVDLKMGFVLLIGGLIGAALGIMLFNYLKSMGQVDLLVKLCYVVFLGIIGGLMFIESINAMRKTARGGVISTRRKHGIIHKLPFKTRFRVSGLYISVDSTISSWPFSWCIGSYNGGWWWVYHGARNDLFAGNAHQGCYRNITFSNHFRYWHSPRCYTRQQTILLILYLPFCCWSVVLLGRRLALVLGSK